MDTQDVKHGGESRNAFEAALDAAALMDAVHDGADGRQHVLMPKTHQLVDITDPHRLPGFVRQRVVLDNRQSLITYANRFKLDQSILLANIDANQISARLDYHDETRPVDDAGDGVARIEGIARHDAHIATLQLRESEPFKAWSEFNGELHSQMDFAAFLEENAEDVTAPDGASLLEIVKDLQLVRDEKFAGRVDLTSGDLGLRFESDTKQVQTVHLPKTITLNMPIWAGEPAIDIVCRLRWRQLGGQAALGIEMKRIEHIKLGLFGEIAAGIAEATGLPVMAGRI